MNKIEKEIESLSPIKWQKVGSQVTCNPPPSGTDIDYLILLNARRPNAISSLGFFFEAGAHYEPSEGQFNSWRKGNVNLIVTDCPIFYEKFVSATNAAKKLNLLLKDERITLFQAILYGAKNE